MARVMDMTEDGVNYHLRRLQAAGLLKREGGRSSGHWVVAQKLNDGTTP
jgi:predicted ArsR family transcriptional regulator